MKTIKGNKLIEINKNKFLEMTKHFEKIEIDLGTGDGRFVFKNSMENPDTLYIGIDPSQKQMQTFSKKSVREKLDNTLFVLGSIEIPPKELKSIADTVHVNFPWGSLLGNIVNTNPQAIKNISNLIKPRGELKIIIGYSHKAEPTEVERLNLDKINGDYIKEEISPAFEKENLKLNKVTTLLKKDLAKIESTWGRKLRFGQERNIYCLEFAKTTH